MLPQGIGEGETDKHETMHLVSGAGQQIAHTAKSGISYVRAEEEKYVRPICFDRACPSNTSLH